MVKHRMTKGFPPSQQPADLFKLVLVRVSRCLSATIKRIYEYRFQVIMDGAQLAAKLKKVSHAIDNLEKSLHLNDN
jgi:hypothetical protein